MPNTNAQPHAKLDRSMAPRTTGRDVKLSAADERPTRVRDPGRDGSGATLLEIESARDVKRSVCFAGNDHQQSNGQAAGRRRRSSVKFGRQVGSERSCWRHSLKRCCEAFCPWTPAVETSRHIDTMRWSSVAAMLITTSGSTLQCATESAKESEVHGR